MKSLWGLLLVGPRTVTLAPGACEQLGLMSTLGYSLCDMVTWQGCLMAPRGQECLRLASLSRQSGRQKI